jgi:hypothetical protein
MTVEEYRMQDVLGLREPGPVNLFLLTSRGRMCQGQRGEKARSDQGGMARDGSARSSGGPWRRCRVSARTCRPLGGFVRATSGVWRSEALMTVDCVAKV